MQPKHSPVERCLSILLILLLLGNMPACTGPTLTARAGWADFDLAMIPVPGGWVHAAGGNLLVMRSDLSMDTLLGTQEITATYNSAPGQWTWNFLLHFDGVTFRDPTGFSMSFEGLPDVSIAHGTHWFRVDGDSLQTKGGLRYDFDGQGRLEAVYWFTFDYPRLRYQHTADEVRIDQCTAPGVCTGVYVAELEEGLPVRVADARTGRVSEYTYDDGLLTHAKSAFETEAGLSGTTYEYEGSLLTAQVSSEGERVEYDYTAGRGIDRVVQIGEGNPTHRFSHLTMDEEHGDLYRTLYTNPLGGRIRMYFDGDRKLREVQYLDTGDIRWLTWISNRRVATDRLPNGATTRYDYGFIGWDPLQITTPSGNVVDITYAYYSLNLDDPTARAIERVEDSIGRVYEATYDIQGRPLSRTNGAGDTVTTSYGFSVFPDSTTAPSGLVTTIPHYGIHGHALAFEGAVADQRAFDLIGNARVSSRNRRTGGLIQSEFDAGRRPATWTFASTQAGAPGAAENVAVARRSDGQPLSIARPGGGDHEFGYDSLGRRISRSERVSGVWLVANYAYDAAGNLLALELPNGMRQEFEYDVYGRKIRHRALREGSVEGERLLTYHEGQLETSWDSVRGTTEVHGYDVAGRPTSVRFGNGDTLTRGFDERSRVTSETWAVASETLADVGYQYDLANRMTLVSEGSTNEMVVGIAYGAGRPVEIHYSNGLTRHIGFDPVTGQLEGAELRDAQGSLLAETTVTRKTEFDPVRSQVSAVVQTSLAATEEEYWLTPSGQLADPGSRLFRWENDEGTALAFSYDAVGNRDGTGQDSFTYNAERNRVEIVSLDGESIDYTYDDAGYVTSRAGVPISWSASGKVASFGADRAVWDMSGRLVELEVGGQLRRFDLFGGRIESDLTNGTIGVLDLHHATIDLGTGERRFRHFDFRNNVSYVTDASAHVLAHYRYRPYGLDTVFGVHQGVDFVGKASFGSLMMLGARVYDPEVGRFLSQDPLLQVANQYAYTSGNPVWFMDASGLVESDTMIKVFGAVIAVAVFVATLPASGVITIAGVTVAQIATGAAVSATVAAAASGVGELVSDGLGLRGGPSSRGDGPSAPGFDPDPGVEDGIPDYVLTLELSYVDPEPPPSCSPRRLSETPNGARWLPWLVAMNVLLGWRVLRSRRSMGRLDERP